MDKDKYRGVNSIDNRLLDLFVNGNSQFDDDTILPFLTSMVLSNPPSSSADTSLYQSTVIINKIFKIKPSSNNLFMVLNIAMESSNCGDSIVDLLYLINEYVSKNLTSGDVEMEMILLFSISLMLYQSSDPFEQELLIKILEDLCCIVVKNDVDTLLKIGLVYPVIALIQFISNSGNKPITKSSTELIIKIQSFIIGLYTAKKSFTPPHFEIDSAIVGPFRLYIQKLIQTIASFVNNTLPQTTTSLDFFINSPLLFHYTNRTKFIETTTKECDFPLIYIPVLLYISNIDPCPAIVNSIFTQYMINLASDVRSTASILKIHYTFLESIDDSIKAIGIQGLYGIWSRNSRVWGK